MEKFKARMRCALVTGHMMINYQTKIVKGVRGEVEAQKTRCGNCFYIQKFWIAKEEGRHPVKYD